ITRSVVAVAGTVIVRGRCDCAANDGAADQPRRHTCSDAALGVRRRTYTRNDERNGSSRCHQCLFHVLLFPFHTRPKLARDFYPSESSYTPVEQSMNACACLATNHGCKISRLLQCTMNVSSFGTEQGGNSDHAGIVRRHWRRKQPGILLCDFRSRRRK